MLLGPIKTLCDQSLVNHNVLLRSPGFPGSEMPLPPRVDRGDGLDVRYDDVDLLLHASVSSQGFPQWTLRSWSLLSIFPNFSNFSTFLTNC